MSHLHSSRTDIFSSITTCLIAALAIMMNSVAVEAQQAGQANNEGKERVELTVYNDNLALVKEQRNIVLTEGVSSVTYQNVAAKLDPTSVTFRSLRDPAGTSVLEQNFEYDLVGSQKLLKKYIDHKIQVSTADGQTYRGTLLSAGNGIVLRTNKGIQVLKDDRIHGIQFPELPEGLRTRPTLVWQVRAQEEGQHTTELSYLTKGMEWRADYIVDLAANDEHMDLQGWVTLNNETGKTYKGANLKLVAGDIHRARDRGQRQRMQREMMAAAAAQDQVQSRQFFEYHLYEITRPVTVKNRQTKQIQFVQGTDLEAQKVYVYNGSSASWRGRAQRGRSYGANTGNKKVEVYLRFTTGEEGGLDRRLPAGKVRMYQEDEDGSALLIGEDRIDHTPKNEAVQLTVGQAFDLVGERTRTDYRRFGDRAIEETFEIRLRNQKPNEEVAIRVVEPLYRGSDWTILRERLKGSQEAIQHEKLDSHQVEWRISVPAEEEAVLTYTVRYQF